MAEARWGTWTGTGAAALLVLLGLAACQGRLAAKHGTEVNTCDVLRGRLVEGRCSQGFTFEGVESSLLDFDLRSDDGSIAAPVVCLFDPDGEEIDVRPYQQTAGGAATTRYRGVVLVRSGAYQAQVTPAVPSPVYYSFEYTLRFPPIRDLRISLKAGDAYPVSIAAPRGGQVIVQITPLGGCGTRVQVDGVEDPWGGRALDPSRRLPNAPPPTVRQLTDGSYFLDFNAPIPGRYTVLAAAQPGFEGPAVVNVEVRSPRNLARAVMHPNSAPEGYGVPAPQASGSASDR